MTNSENFRDSSSFKDPDGHIFYSDSNVYREVYESYNDNYTKLMDSGLYEELTQKNLLIQHEEVESDNSNRVLKMDKLDFISYPYEWTFSQLKDAALLTLKVERIAENYGMTLKDASAYNIQFQDGNPIFIDTLSFEKKENDPWRPYRQFCRHFIAPLALMKYTDIRLNQLTKQYIDGIPLDLASKLLSNKTYLSLNLLIHIHIHSRFQSLFSKDRESKEIEMSSKMLSSFKNNLNSAIEKLKSPNNNNSDGDKIKDSQKIKILEKYLETIEASETWILNKNTSNFHKVISDNTENLTVSLHEDPSDAENIYDKQSGNILPLIQDMVNPSSNIGWNNSERKSIFERGNTDLVVALNLTHYLSLSDNIPIFEQAKFFAEHFEKLIIEFIPKEEPEAQDILSLKQESYDNYCLEVFEQKFREYFNFVEIKKLENSNRKIYLMKRKQ